MSGMTSRRVEKSDLEAFIERIRPGLPNVGIIAEASSLTTAFGLVVVITNYRAANR